jgi:Cu2+-exporting ATPase
LSTGAAYLFSLFNTFYPEFFITRGLEPNVYYESATVIITLILLGRYFEERAKFRTTGAIKKLMGIQPRHIHIQQNGQTVVKSISEVKKGEIFTVKPGEKIALDGFVINGISYVDESMINGEPVPSEKAKEDYVYAGTINQNGTLDIIVEKESDNTLLAQIIDLVKKAQASKPPIQKIADKISSIFVPSVIVIALISFLIWYFVGPEPKVTYSFVILIAVLIIACPCALGLTGTITIGKPEVLKVKWQNDHSMDKESNILALLESRSEHPLATAILEYLKWDPEKNESSVSNNKIEFQNVPGLGIIGTYEGIKYFSGNKKLVESNGISIDNELIEFEKRLLDEAYTIVYFGNESEVISIFGIRDPYREGVKGAIKDLQKTGIDIILLSGDNKIITEKIANELNIKQFAGAVLPHQKGEFIKKFKAEGKNVAMAGDGINDAQALAEADIGIAMGSGTDIAMESAGITLMKSDIDHVRDAIYLSKATVKTIHQNLFWAFAYNILAIPIAAGVLFPFTGFLLNPMIAGAAMAFSSVSVVTNSLKLKRKRII